MSNHEFFSFSDRLCRAAHIAGLSWPQLARLSDVPMRTINGLLNEEIEPAEEIVNKLAATCDVSARWLASGISSPAARRAIESALAIKADERLGPDGWPKMKNVLETLAGADELKRS